MSINSLCIYALGIAIFLSIALTGTELKAFSPPPNNLVTINKDPGGKIITYALKVSAINQKNDYVKFAGYCDSACTLHLAIPHKRICITPKASFGFHLPYGVSAHQAAVARDYMLNRYPKWVKEWIYANGGLTSQIIRMPYSHAKNHMKTCGSA